MDKAKVRHEIQVEVAAYQRAVAFYVLAAYGDPRQKPSHAAAMRLAEAEQAYNVTRLDQPERVVDAAFRLVNAQLEFELSLYPDDARRGESVDVKVWRDEMYYRVTRLQGLASTL